MIIRLHCCIAWFREHYVPALSIRSQLNSAFWSASQSSMMIFPRWTSGILFFEKTPRLPFSFHLLKAKESKVSGSLWKQQDSRTAPCTENQNDVLCCIEFVDTTMSMFFAKLTSELKFLLPTGFVWAAGEISEIKVSVEPPQRKQWQLDHTKHAANNHFTTHSSPTQSPRCWAGQCAPASLLRASPVVYDCIPTVDSKPIFRVLFRLWFCNTLAQLSGPLDPYIQSTHQNAFAIFHLWRHPLSSRRDEGDQNVSGTTAGERIDDLNDSAAYASKQPLFHSLASHTKSKELRRSILSCVIDDGFPCSARWYSTRW